MYCSKPTHAIIRTKILTGIIDQKYDFNHLYSLIFSIKDDTQLVNLLYNSILDELTKLSFKRDLKKKAFISPTNTNTNTNPIGKPTILSKQISALNDIFLYPINKRSISCNYCHKIYSRENICKCHNSILMLQICSEICIESASKSLLFFRRNDMHNKYVSRAKLAADILAEYDKKSLQNVFDKIISFVQSFLKQSREEMSVGSVQIREIIANIFTLALQMEIIILSDIDLLN